MRLSSLNPNETIRFVPAIAAGTLLASSAASVFFFTQKGFDENTTLSLSCALISVAVLYASIYNLKVWKRSKTLAKTEVLLKYTPGEKKTEPVPKIKYKIPNH